MQASEKIGEGIDAAKDTLTDLKNALDPDWLVSGVSRPDFRIIMGGGGGSLRGLRQAKDVPAANGASEPGVWITLRIPENAGLFQFDFTVTGPPVDDCIAAAVGGHNVFNLPASFAPEGEVQSTDMMDISAYAGQTD